MGFVTYKTTACMIMIKTTIREAEPDREACVFWTSELIDFSCAHTNATLQLFSHHPPSVILCSEKLH